MKTIQKTKKWPFLVMGLLLSVILFSACSKDDNDYTPPPSSGLMLFNLAPDKPSVYFTLSGNRLGNGFLGYTSFSGTYLPVYTGSRELRSVDGTNGSSIALTTQNFIDSNYYSAFLLGMNGQYRNLIVRDSYVGVTPVAGKAWVRYVNAIPDSSSIPNVTVGGSTQPATYGLVSAFSQVDVGDVNIAINSGAFNANRTITLSENKIYTVLFVGDPASIDPLLMPQVKFIENGTATE